MKYSINQGRASCIRTLISPKTLSEFGSQRLQLQSGWLLFKRSVHALNLVIKQTKMSDECIA